LKLTIFAATGGIGRQALEQAVAAGHTVTAVARNPRELHGAVRTVTAELLSPDAGVLASAVEGADAVLSCLGPRSKADAGVASKGTAAIIAAMQTAGVRRIVVVSAAPVATVALPGRPAPPKHDPGDGFFMRYLLGPGIRAALKSVYVDLAIMEDELRQSGLDWTAVRPPRLNSKALTTTSRTAIGTNVRGGVAVSRADVAHLMLAVLNQPETIGRTIGIAN
jgi:putative NADH-flavin reductase